MGQRWVKVLKKSFIGAGCEAKIVVLITRRSQVQVLSPQPSQKATKNAGINSAFASAVYPQFIELARKLDSQYISLITPSRWMTKTGQGISNEWVDSIITGNHFICINEHCCTQQSSAQHDYPCPFQQGCAQSPQINFSSLCHFNNSLWHSLLHCNIPKHSCQQLQRHHLTGGAFFLTFLPKYCLLCWILGRHGQISHLLRHR